MDLPFSGQWGDAELFGPSTVLYPSTRPQARDTSRTNSLQLYQSSTSAHLHNLPPTPEDSELHFFNLFPEVSDAMPELPWHSEPPALRMVHTMDFDNLPAAPVAAEQFRMMPGVVCPSETQFGDAMHPQRYAELLACHNPDPQGCALSDTSSNLDYSNVESTAPLLEQSPARSERMPSMDYFAEQGPPAYNHAPQPFRPTVSTDMPPPRPTRSLSVGPHVTEPVSARGVRASSLPIDHIYVPPNLFNRADVNCWLVEQAQAPELHSFHEAPRMISSSYAAPSGQQPTHHHLQSLPPTTHHHPHTNQAPSDPRSAQRFPSSWSNPNLPHATAHTAPGNTRITHLQTQSTAGPSRNAASQHPGMISLDALSGCEQARLPPTSATSTDPDIRSQFHSWASSNSSSPVFDSHLTGEDLCMPQSASASSALVTMATAYPSEGVKPLQMPAGYLSDGSCKQEPSLVHWIPPPPLTGSPLGSCRNVKREPGLDPHFGDNNNSSAIPSAWLVAQPIRNDPFAMIPRPETPATPSVGRFAPGTYRISPQQSQGSLPVQPAGFRHPAQHQVLAMHDSRSSFTNGVPLVVPQTGNRPSFMFGGAHCVGVTTGMQDGHLSGSPSRPCQLREMSNLPAFSQGGNIRTTLCAFKKSVQTPGADRWPQRSIDSLQVLKQDVQQDPLLTSNQRQALTGALVARVDNVLLNPRNVLSPELNKVKQARCKEKAESGPVPKKGKKKVVRRNTASLDFDSDDSY